MPEMKSGEGLSDPIFLFQRRLIMIRSLDLPGIEYDGDEELRIEDWDMLDDWMKELEEDSTLEYCESGEQTLSGGRIPLDHAFMVKALGKFDIHGNPVCVEQWETEHVWSDRDEAHLWGQNHNYRFEYGWRVYSVPAMGQLVKTLRKSDAESRVFRLKSCP